MTASILLVDDHDVVRKGLQALLADEFPEAQFGTAATAAEAVKQLTAHSWNLVVLDLSMPDSSGLQTIETVHQASPNSRILVFTMYSEEQLGVRAIRAGAHGYLMKDAAVDSLAAAIRQVLEGHRYLSPMLVDKLAQTVNRPAGGGIEKLSNRELFVLRRIGQGHATGDIAEQLGLSVKTISTYRSRMLEKLQLRTTADLVRYALEHKLAD